MCESDGSTHATRFWAARLEGGAQPDAEMPVIWMLCGAIGVDDDLYVSPVDRCMQGLRVVMEGFGLAGEHAGDGAAILPDGALVGEVVGAVIGGVLSDDDAGLIGWARESEGDQAVLDLQLGLIDEPVEMIGLSGLLVQEHDGSSHDAWYVGGNDARIVCPVIAG